MTLFRRILVPLDFSEHATRALALATELAREHGGRILVLHVITPFHPVAALPEETIAWVPDGDLVAGERRHLEALVTRTVTGPKAPAVACKVEIGDPFARIVDAARHADCVVMATAGRTGLSHLLIGSVAEKVVRHSPVPVLTVRPARARAARAPGRAGAKGKTRRTARHR